MGIFSWLRFRRSARQPGRTDNPEQKHNREHNLVRYRYDDPKLEPLRRAVAEDVASIEEDDRHHGGDTPPGDR